MNNQYPPKGRFNLPAIAVLGTLVAFWGLVLYLVVSVYSHGR